MITKPVKYTEEFVKNELEKLEQDARIPDILVIGELFENRKYSRQRFCEWAVDFKDNRKISDSIKRIKQIFENKINSGALKGKLNATMAIFNLKNNYGYTDKTEVEQTTLKVETDEDITKEKADEIRRAIFNSTSQLPEKE